MEGNESPKYDISWMDDAECHNYSNELFYPKESRGIGYAAAVAVAKEVCGSCPVRSKCLDYALKTDQQYGIWGGTTIRDRENIKWKLGK